MSLCLGIPTIEINTTYPIGTIAVGGFAIHFPTTAM
jgi:hypothetical protein